MYSFKLSYMYSFKLVSFLSLNLTKNCIHLVIDFGFFLTIINYGISSIEMLLIKLHEALNFTVNDDQINIINSINVSMFDQKNNVAISCIIEEISTMSSQAYHRHVTLYFFISHNQKVFNSYKRLLNERI